MKNYLTRLLAFILAFVITVSSVPPVWADAATAEQQNEEDYSSSANPADILLSREGTKEAADDGEESTEIADIIQGGLDEFMERMEADCAITDVQVADGSVFVAYHSNLPGYMTVNIYEQTAYDNGETVISASCEKTAAEATNASMGDMRLVLPIVNGSVPDYYYTEVVFSDENGEILDSYMDNTHIEEIQEIIAAGDPYSDKHERVVYLNGTRDSYVLINDSVAIIADGNSYSVAFSNDGTLTLSGIPEQFSDFSEAQLSELTGVVLMLSTPVDENAGYQSGVYQTIDSNTSNMLPLMVRSGETIRKTADGTGLVFPYVPVSELKAEMVLSGFHFEAQNGEQIPNGKANARGIMLLASVPIRVSKSANGGKMSGTVSPEVTPSGSIDFSFTQKKFGFHVGMKFAVSYDLKFTGKTSSETYTKYSKPEFYGDNSISAEIFNRGLTVFPGLKANVKLTMLALFNGEGSISGEVHWEFGLGASVSNGFSKVVDAQDNVIGDPNDFIQLGFAADVGLSGSIGIDLVFLDLSFDFLTGKVIVYIIERLVKNKDDGKVLHYCFEDTDKNPGCVQWFERSSVRMDIGLEVNLYFWKDHWNEELFENTFSERDKYHSYTYDEGGTGMCPHKGWPVKVTVQYTSGRPAADKMVTVPEYDSDSADFRVKKYSQGKTDENGEIIIYIPAGSSKVIQATDGNRVGKTEPFDVIYGTTDLEKTIILPEAYEVEVVWNDASNKSGKRPESVALHIEKQVSEDSAWVHEDTEVPVEVSNWEDNKGSASVEVASLGAHRARLDAEAKEYTYNRVTGEETIQVVKLGEVLYKVEYEDEKSEDEDGKTTVTLTEMKQYSVEIKWDADIENKDHPSKVNVELQYPVDAAKDYADIDLWLSDESIELSDSNDWKGEFIPVEAYDANGKETTYRVREIRQIADAVDQYADLPVWDEDDKDKVAELWENVPLVNNKRNYVSYDVDEYTSLIKGGQVEKHSTKYKASYETEGTKTTITNLAIVDVTVYKKWAMLGEAEKPDSAWLMVLSKIDSQFLENSETNVWTPAYDPIAGDTTKLADLISAIPDFIIPDYTIPFAVGKTDEEKGWKVSYTLRKYSVGIDGVGAGLPLEFQGVEATSALIATVINLVVKYYTGADISIITDYISFNPIDGYVSTHMPKAIPIPGLSESNLYSVVLNTWYKGKGDEDEKERTLTGMKVWEDEDDKEGKRPESVTVKLKKDGKNYQEFVLSEDTDWAWCYTVPVEDKDAEFTIEEEPIDYYKASYNGLMVVNRYTGEKLDKINVDVICKWEDNDNADGLRPKDVTVTLAADDKETDKKLSLSAADKWEDTFREVSVYSDENKEKEIVYKLKAPAVEGYEGPVVTGNARNGFVVSYKHTSEQITISGQKTWDDKGDEAAKRPETIVLRLHANGKELTELQVNGKKIEDGKIEISAGDNWSWKITELPKYHDGKEIEYTITEDAIENYVPEIDGFDITNTLNEDTTGETTVTVSKVWEDQNDRDGIRPPEVIVKLLADGEETGIELVLDNANNWTGTFTDLSINNDNGQKIEYSVAEKEVKGYTEPLIEGNMTKGFTITNTHTVETVTVKGEKIWENDNPRIRPESITVTLLANGKEIDTKKVKADDAGNWTWMFEALPKYEDGNEITYSFKEEAIENYTTVYVNHEIYNIFGKGETSITVKKVWDDNNNSDGKRPESVVVKLLKNGEDTKQRLFLRESSNWVGTFKFLPVYDENGGKIEYTIDEVISEELKAYTNEISGDSKQGFTIKNTYKNETVTIEGIKYWDDNSENNFRPDRIVVRLLAAGEEVAVKTVEPNAAGEWTWKFENMPKYRNGEEIDYTITEDDVDKYSLVYIQTSYPEKAGDPIVFELTNEYTPTYKSVAVSKLWDDDNNRDGLRPNEVTIEILQDGNSMEPQRTVTLNEENSWSGIFTKLPVDNGTDHDYSYTVKELDVPEGYEVSILGTAKKGYTVKNTHEPERIAVSGTKTWIGDTEENRPEYITIRLISTSDGVSKEKRTVKVEPNAAGEWTWTFEGLHKYKNGKEIVYTVAEAEIEDYYSRADGMDVTNTYQKATTTVAVSKVWEDDDNRDGKRPEQVIVNLLADGKPCNRKLELNEANGWTGTFEDLPVYSKDQEIKYTVEELKADAYDTAITGDAEKGFTITNTHETELLDIEGSKTWIGDTEETRPDSITIRLLANGKEADSQTVTAENDWAWCFKDKNVYENGRKIDYTVSEDAVEHYVSEVDDYNVKNTYSPGFTSITVSKVWVDNENRDGLRPKEVTVKLFANGKETGDTLTLDAANHWSAAFNELPVKGDDAAAIAYTVEEKPVEGYTAEITGDAKKGFTVTNTHAIETTTVEGEKIWNDRDDTARPESITIRLLANGKEKQSLIVTADDDGNWTWKFENLPVYENGEKIIYTLKEDVIENYTTIIMSDFIVNSYQKGMTSIIVNKVWDDENDRDKKRPENVTIKLLANGNETVDTLILDKYCDWSGTFRDVAVYDENSAKINYTVEEVTVDGYTSIITGDAKRGYTITNTHKAETVTVEGEKTWEGEITKNLRPKYIIIRLLANGEEVSFKKVTPDENGKWSWRFEDVPKYDQGEPIVYSVAEDAVESYSSEVDGMNVINTYTPAYTSVAVRTVWNDGHDRDGIRPTQVTAKLIGEIKTFVTYDVNDEDPNYKTLDLNLNNNWAGLWSDLPTDDGEGKIQYYVEGQKVAGYTMDITGNERKGFVITYTHNPGMTVVSGSKTWKNDTEEMRPEYIVISLYANGHWFDEIMVTPAEDGTWSWEFSDLDKYWGGEKVQYTILEQPVENYATSVDGYNVINTYSPGNTSLNVMKVWKDQNNKDKIRPESVIVKLMADGVYTGKTVVLEEANNWMSSFTEIPMYDGTRRISYSVEEVAVRGYTAVVTGDAKTGYTITNTHIPGPTPPPPPGPSPYTGDTSSALLWLSLMTFSFAGAIILLKKLRRE